MIGALSGKVLKLLGWTVSSSEHSQKKYILIGAPHTTNWDFPLTLLTMWTLGIKFSWVAKHTLFISPLGYVLKKIGGIPVDRNVRTGFLTSMAQAFDNDEALILAIAPEGTRSRTNHWKAGFYNIALKAKVDIRFGFIDYPSKTVGLGPFLTPTGDVEADFVTIRDFYKDKRGKFPEKESVIKLRDREAAILRREIERSSKKSEPNPSTTI